MLNAILKQAEEQKERAEALRLVKQFQKNHEKGEFRNKLGRVWWPVWNKVIVPAASLLAITAGVSAAFVSGGMAAIPGIAFGSALWGVGHIATKGFAVNVQNIAIKNAGLFGRDMCRQNVSENVRKKAILIYLNKSGAWFFNRKYVKENSAEINKMANGEKGNTINNLIALTEYNLTRERNHLQRKRAQLPLSRRVEIYRRSYQTYQAIKSSKQVLPFNRDGSR